MDRKNRHAWSVYAIVDQHEVKAWFRDETNDTGERISARLDNSRIVVRVKPSTAEALYSADVWRSHISADSGVSDTAPDEHKIWLAPFKLRR